MDPLSLTASVIAIIQLADRIISVCKDYVTTVKDAPNDLRTIFMEVGSVKCVLELLELVIPQGDNDNVSVILEKLRTSNGPIEGCKQALTALDSLFPVEVECPARGKRRKILRSLKDLAWPFKEGKARRLLEDIGRHKATISLALTTETAYDIKSIKTNVKDMRDSLNSEERQSILKWLVATDPSPNHNRACDLHEPHTGTWLINSPEYEDWVSGSTRFLWLHGIPGSGKTVLASFIVENLKQFCKTSALHDTALAYYYFYFRREKDEASHLLRWVIAQLCRQSKCIPNQVRELYDAGAEPTTASLVTALSIVLRCFNRVYLVLDALDESSNRPNLLDVLLQVAGDANFKKIRLLALSRKETDIERVLEHISTGISLQNSRVDEDIRLYIQNQLCEDRKFSRWPKSLRAEIETALVKGAKGMFRWAFCQLDVLGRLNSASEIRKALQRLPETLDETYERILNSIPAENCKYAHRALQLLSLDSSINHLSELAEAVIVDDEQCSFSLEDRFLNAEDLLEICTCLVTFAEGDTPEVRLAHYTVKEYLTSERIRATTFRISDVAAEEYAAKISIIYLLNVDYERIPKILDYEGPDCLRAIRIANEKFPFIRHAIVWWKLYAFAAKGEVPNLALKLLNPRKPHFSGWWELSAACFFETSSWDHLPKWIFPSGAESSASLAYACYFDLIDVAKILLEQNPGISILKKRLEQDTDVGLEPVPTSAYGTVLHIAAALKKPSIVKLLIERGADTKAIAGSGFTVLHSALHFYVCNDCYTTEECCEVVKLLLAHGADPNPPCMAETPLQAAVRNWAGLAAVQALMDAGADVNAVGVDEAVLAKIRYDLRDEEDQDIVDKAIHSREDGHYFDTPLQIAENRRNQIPSENFVPEYEERELSELRELLSRYGAKSLHLFPVEG